MGPRRGSVLVLSVSGLLGLRLGWVAFPAWQVAVETAQVVAGVVRYPSTTPFFIYHVKLWTILHQLLAVGFRLGLSEIQLSLIVSAVAGMVSLQALAIVVYALSGDALLSVGSALLIYFSRASELGVAYPIYLMGSADTYGMLGLSFITLVAGLLGAGCDRTAFFLAGLAPAVHPSLGLGLGVILGVSFAWDREALRNRLLPSWAYLLAGCSMTAISGVVQLSEMRGIPAIDHTVAERYLEAFVQFWDIHRAAIPLMSRGVAANVGVCAVAAVWLNVFSPDLTPPGKLLLRLAIVSAALSLMFVLLSWLPPGALPQWLLILMPSRILNLDSMMAAPIVIGLIGAYRQSTWSPCLILALAAGMLLANDSMLWTWLARHAVSIGVGPTNLLFSLAVAVMLLVAMAAIHVSRRSRGRSTAPRFPNLAITARGAWVGSFVALAVVAGGVARPRAMVFDDRTTDPLFRAAAGGNGILVTAADLHLIQLRTRRPVLVDGGGLDGLPYALESAPALGRILRDVYGIDFFHPPADVTRGGRLPRATNQIVWERLTRDEWRGIRHTYGATGVVAWTDWTLALPIEAENGELRLYSIPE